MMRVTRRSVLVVYSYRAVTGLLVGYPAARAAGAVFATRLPDGDRELFSAGGFELLETLRLGARTLPAALEGGSVVGLVLSLGAIVPLAAALEGLLRPEATTKRVFAAALERLSPLLLLTGLALLAQAALLVATSFVAGAAENLTSSMKNELAGDALPGGIALVGGSCVLLVGVVQDFARAAVLGRDAKALAAVRIALASLSGAKRRTLGAYAVTALGSLSVVAFAATLTTLLDVSRPGALRVLAVLAVHQLAVLGLVTLRLYFLGTALGVVGKERTAAADPEGIPLPPGGLASGR